jgi:hypothetical protein
MTGGAGAQVGETRVVNLPGSTFGGDKERRLQVLVRAEGPTCVLSVTDLVVRLAQRTPHPASSLPRPRGPSMLRHAPPSAAPACLSPGSLFPPGSAAALKPGPCVTAPMSCSAML